MKILIINPILFTADNNKFPKVNSIKDCMIYTVALGFKNLGHEITLAASLEYKPINDEVYDFNVLFFKSYFTKLLLPSVLPFPLGMWKYLRQNKGHFDLIISGETFSFPSLFASLIARRKTVIWQELTIHNNKFHKIPSKTWYSIIAKIFMQNVLVIGRSPAARDFIVKYMNRVSEDWVDPGINLEKFKYSNSKNANFIIVSQLIERKNIGSVISIFQKFLQKWTQYKEFKLFIAGRGEEETSLKKMVADNNLSENVIFLGFLSHAELNKYISESYAILFNTKKDLNIVSIPESIVSGTPVITNEIYTLASHINSKKLGIAKNNWNEDDLKEIIENNQYYVNNCNAIRNEMSKESAAKKLIDIYESAARSSESIAVS